MRRDQNPDGKYDINNKRESGLNAVPNSSADRLLALIDRFESDVDIFLFGDFEITYRKTYKSKMCQFQNNLLFYLQSNGIFRFIFC